jgi:hypothetical protein
MSALCQKRTSAGGSDEGGAEKRQEFAGADPEVDVIGGHNLTKPLGNASEFDVCRFGCQVVAAACESGLLPECLAHAIIRRLRNPRE